MHSDNEMVNLRSVIETLCYMVDDDSDGVEEVMQLPSIDIVRCAECMFSKVYQNDSSGVMGRFCEAFTQVRMVSDDDFCSYGGREGE